MMREEYKKEEFVVEKTEFDKEMELIENIIKTREELNRNNINFEFAENELVDYYTYQIKANQAKLNYLIRIAKSVGISMDTINQYKYENYSEKLG